MTSERNLCGTIRGIIEKSLAENPCSIDIRCDEPMAEHTTFKIGGPADCWVQPQVEGFPAFCTSLLNYARAAGVPVFILGGGANIVVSDNGISGIVLDTGAWTGQVPLPYEQSSPDNTQLIFRSGTAIDKAAEFAAAAGLSGLEFLAGMPGSVGGAVWMNARCYEREIADVLSWTEIISIKHGFPQIERIDTDKDSFGYKYSLFQEMDCLIISAAFKLMKSEENVIRNEMEKNRQDREKKGHYLFPSAGSAFKNNRDFGKPTGKIIDELGLKGFSVGGAQVAPFHGNFIINKGGASASDIRTLVDVITAKVQSETGFVLESEILFVGR